MASPINKEYLQGFLGILTCLSKFIPNLSQVAAPLRALLEYHTEWQWCHKHEGSFLKSKEISVNASVLHHFKPDQSIMLSVDASSKGLGAVILQNEHPIAYASRALSTTQQHNMHKSKMKCWPLFLDVQSSMTTSMVYQMSK